jgi:hypothetical protein
LTYKGNTVYWRTPRVTAIILLVLFSKNGVTL